MELRRRLLVLSGTAAAVLALSGATPAAARLVQTRDDALRLVFGAGAAFTPRTAWLRGAEADSVAAWAQARGAAAPVTYWVATLGDRLLGRAYLDTRIVRTMPATVLVAVGTAHQVIAVQVLAFQEPADYLPPRRWLERFAGKILSRRLRPGDDVNAISGATLSVRAFAAAVRWALALDRFVTGTPS